MRNTPLCPVNYAWKYLLIACASIILSVNNLSAQSLSWEEFVERMTADDENEYTAWEYLYEELADRHEHPFNLQTLTRAQLETLPFLDDTQIENLLAYLYAYGPLLSVSELQLVEGLDAETRRLLALFVYVGRAPVQPRPFRWRNLARYGRHEATVRTDVPLYYRKGFYKHPAEELAQYPNRQYLGDPTYQSLRYQYSYGSQVAAGLTAEKDAGEPFGAHGNRGYDSYSFYLLLHDVWKFETLAVGDYRLSFGQGLVMNTGFSLGKQSVLASLGGTKGIRKHASTNEDDFFRGVAASVRSGRFVYTGFYSFRQEDGTLEKGLITALKTDGYHRTPGEMEKKHAYNNQMVGSNLTYRNRDFQMGLTAVYNVFDRLLIPSAYAYKRHDPSGRHFYAVGTDYRYHRGRFSVSGETAVSQGGGMATLNLCRYRFSPSFRVLLLHRYYAKDYGGWYARSFEEGGRVRNEHGAYVGVEASPWGLCQLTAYADFFRFPFRKYRLSVDGSQGMEAMVQASALPRRAFAWLARYQYKSRGEDFVHPATGGKGVAARTTHKVKLQGTYGPWPWLRAKTTVYCVRTGLAAGGAEQGCLLSEALAFAGPAKRWQAEVGGAYFHTDSYEARVYAYERGLLYSFASSSFYGRGVRGYLWLRYDMNKLLTCLVKYGCTAYFDRSSISSGAQTIEGSRKQDLYFQLRLKF